MMTLQYIEQRAREYGEACARVGMTGPMRVMVPFNDYARLFPDNKAIVHVNTAIGRMRVVPGLAPTVEVAADVMSVEHWFAHKSTL